VSQQLRVETISELGPFSAMREEWNGLLACSRADGLFLTWEWLHSWWTHAGGRGRLALLAVRSGTQLVGLAPLQSRRSAFGGARLEFLGIGRAGSDYLDLIARQGSEADVVASLARHVAGSGAVLDLKQVRLVGSTASGLLHALRRSGCSIRAARTHRCPFIDLEGRSWDTYLGSLGSEHRYSFRRKLRKLRAGHEMSFEVASSEAQRNALLPVLFELHRRRWSERGADGLGGLEPFHECVSRLALERGWLRLCVLRLDGEPVAALYGFRYGRVFYFYQAGFDPRWHAASVGTVMLGLCIERAMNEGAAEFDMLHGQEPYKFHWGCRSRRLARISVFSRAPRARLSLGVATAAVAARGLLRRLPAGLAAGFVPVGRGGNADAAPTR
jgi:CelD/BcsL family acetyltransferase involved in cellulose biosynthesis